ncbi:MAG: hypothetical protein KDB10_14000 [Acidimicrobiales bacterium]|nr:hypothetical protein [Acidimicrobiales bacterium]MCB9373716.1 hypothetical protein [Microthrixaceae bacterium]
MSGPASAVTPTGARVLARRGVRRAHELLGDSPVFLPLQRLLTPESARDRAVTAHTELVIEGFPRSGNTFAAKAFALAQSRPVVVASHVHLPAQVKLAVRRGVPTLVLVRDPVDAAVSMAIADPHHRVEHLVDYWIHYHRQVAPLADGYLLVTFAEVTGDFGAVVDRCNERFGTTFDRFDHTPPAVDRVFAAIDEKQRAVHGETRYRQAVPRPDESRSDARRVLEARLAEPRAATAVARARALHDELVAAR